MTPTERRTVAERLWNAEIERKPILNFKRSNSKATLEDAYQIQELNAQKRMATGEVLKGYKIGLTSHRARVQLNLHEPDYGHLFEKMEIKNGKLSLHELIQPKIEGEIAFVLKKDLKGPGITRDKAMDAVDHVRAAMEIVDTRIENWEISGEDTVADNGSSARYVLGEKKTSPQGLDFYFLGMNLIQNGEIIVTGSGAAVMDDPLEALAFLANELGKHGKTLEAGQVVLSGSLSTMIRMTRPSRFDCDFKTLGRVSLEVVP